MSTTEADTCRKFVVPNSTRQGGGRVAAHRGVAPTMSVGAPVTQVAVADRWGRRPVADTAARAGQASSGCGFIACPRDLIDTNVVSELRKPRPNARVVQWLENIDDKDLFLSSVTVGEIQAGIEITREQDPSRTVALEIWAG